MEIGGLNPISGISGGPVDQGEISEETFLQLLSAQLQHQDPLEPASDVEFIQQMATFASLEQQRITNANLNVVQLYENSINNSNALNIVGKEVKLQDNILEHEEGESHTFFYDSDSSAARVNITVLDGDGKEVYASTQIGSEDGEQEFTWYGVDNDGQAVAEGEYTVHVELENAEGDEFNSTIYQIRRVNGVSYENGGILALVGDRKIPIENIVEVYESQDGGGGGPGQFLSNGKNGSQMPYGPFGLTQTVPGFDPAHLFSQQQQLQRPFRVFPGGR